jgi:hypothetical protein
MISKLDIRGTEYAIDLDNPTDISIPLCFNGSQPNAYGVESATSKPVEAGDLVGDTRLGGSVNFEQYTLIPHCNGTHTECVGHITHERISVRECLRDVFMPTLLLSVEPERADNTDDTYSVDLASDDLLITLNALRSALPSYQFQASVAARGANALIIRTLPNDESKLTRQYGEIIPPFLSTEAVQHIVESGYKHLLIDLPSIDRIFDGGVLSNHRRFWNIEAGSFETNTDSRIYRTITELIYVPNVLLDGEYLLNLQIAPFEADASPSRPMLFKIL